jgi:sugar lactone lactonase YvrE
MNYLCQTLVNLECSLGEGLIWDSRSNQLLMTDILSKELIQISVHDQKIRTWVLPEYLSWVGLTNEVNVYLLGLQTGIALFDVDRPIDLQWVNRDFPDKLSCRLNDFDTDSYGRIWYGSMNHDYPSITDGCLASFSNTDGLKIHDRGFTVTNGPLISPDESFIYFSDTLKSKIYRYQLSVSTGDIFNKELFYQFDLNQGFPDGMSFDVDGNLWVAMWGGAKVLKIDLLGKIAAEFCIPAINVSNVCFGGEKLDRLFVSTARAWMNAEELMRQPSAGSVFEIIDHGTKGFNSYQYIK